MLKILPKNAFRNFPKLLPILLLNILDDECSIRVFQHPDFYCFKRVLSLLINGSSNFTQ